MITSQSDNPSKTTAPKAKAASTVARKSASRAKAKTISVRRESKTSKVLSLLRRAGRCRNKLLCLAVNSARATRNTRSGSRSKVGAQMAVARHVRREPRRLAYSRHRPDLVLDIDWLQAVGQIRFIHQVYGIAA